MYKRKRVCLIVLFLLLLCYSMPLPVAAEQPVIYTISVNDMVTAGTAKHIQRGLILAENNGADAAVILLNTPGGLVTATLDILQAMSASNIPVITYVSPEGAIAASAGVFILINGHIAAMSPGTTCGAAMPVTMPAPGEETRAADQKTINFLAGHIKSTAGERGRPGDLAEKFVTENLTLENNEALEQGIVDLNANSLSELTDKIHGMKTRTKAGDMVMNTAGAGIKDIPMNLSEQAIDVFSNPTLAMILLMLGIYGLIIGFYSPGFYLPEVLGSICLITGLAGIGLFQGNLTAGLLILLGIGLLVAEFFAPTHGALGTGGIISIILGILFFPAEPLMPTGWFAMFKVMAFGTGVIGAVLVFIVVLGVSRLRRRKPAHGEAEFINKTGVVVEELKPSGQIKLKGEIWQAFSKNGHTIGTGEKVKVIERRGLNLIVEPASNDLDDIT